MAQIKTLWGYFCASTLSSFINQMESIHVNWWATFCHPAKFTLVGCVNRDRPNRLGAIHARYRSKGNHSLPHRTYATDITDITGMTAIIQINNIVFICRRDFLPRNNLAYLISISYLNLRITVVPRAVPFILMNLSRIPCDTFEMLQTGT